MIKKIAIITTIVLIGASILLIMQNANPSETLIQSDKKETNLKNEKPDLLKLILQAESLYNSGKKDEAIEKYKEANALDENSILPYIGIAKIYMETDKIDSAEQNIISAQKKSALNDEGKIVLARLHIIKNNLQQAREVLQSMGSQTNETILLNAILNLLTNNNEKADSLIDELIASQIEDKFKETGKKFKEAFDIYATFVDSPTSYLLTLSGQKLIDANEYILARPLLFAAIEQKNDYRDAWLLLGYSYLLSEKFEEAEQSLTKAKQIDPYFAKTYLYLGLAEQSNGKITQSAETLKQAISFGYKDEKNVYLEIAESYFKNKDYESSIEYYDKALATGKIDIDSYVKIVWIFIDPLSNPNEALARALKSVSEYPDMAMSYNLAGWAYLNLNNFTEAKNYLNKAINLDPRLDATYLNLGVLYKKQNNFTLASETLNKAIQLAEENGSISIKLKATQELSTLTTQ